MFAQVGPMLYPTWKFDCFHPATLEMEIEHEDNGWIEIAPKKLMYLQLGSGRSVCLFLEYILVRNHRSKFAMPPYAILQ